MFSPLKVRTQSFEGFLLARMQVDAVPKSVQLAEDRLCDGTAWQMSVVDCLQCPLLDHLITCERTKTMAWHSEPS